MKFKLALFLILIIAFLLQNINCKSITEPSSLAHNSIVQLPQSVDSTKHQNNQIIVGAANLAEYLPIIKNKKVGLVVNATSTIGTTHLVDTLKKLNIDIQLIFAPEHGFRGTADAGEHINNSIDKATGLPIVSLYGSHKAPTMNDLEHVDVLIFDIQDVGARFYTYISTLHYVMIAAAQFHKKLLILDRPNPNGNYIDGSILEKKFESFVGMHPVPIVHGMTIGEYATMIDGENWLIQDNTVFHPDFTVIKCSNYTHEMQYNLPIKPSPNLPNNKAIYLYPSLCLFEGTPISVGRGTTHPFQMIGHPSYKNLYQFNFTPVSTSGAKTPVLQNEKCYGIDFTGISNDSLFYRKQIDIQYLIGFYKNYTDKSKFFIPFFNSLAGNSKLQNQIISGASADEIRASWQDGLNKFKLIRQKYLLYK